MIGHKLRHEDKLISFITEGMIKETRLKERSRTKYKSFRIGSSKIRQMTGKIGENICSEEIC